MRLLPRASFFLTAILPYRRERGDKSRPQPLEYQSCLEMPSCHQEHVALHDTVQRNAASPSSSFSVSSRVSPISTRMQLALCMHALIASPTCRASSAIRQPSANRPRPTMILHTYLAVARRRSSHSGQLSSRAFSGLGCGPMSLQNVRPSLQNVRRSKHELD